MLNYQRVSTIIRCIHLWGFHKQVLESSLTVGSGEEAPSEAPSPSGEGASWEDELGWTHGIPQKMWNKYIYIMLCRFVMISWGFRGNWNLKLQGLENHFPSCNAHKPGVYLNPMFILRQGHRKVKICDSGDQRILHCYGPKKHPVVVWAFLETV